MDTHVLFRRKNGCAHVGKSGVQEIVICDDCLIEIETLREKVNWLNQFGIDCMKGKSELSAEIERLESEIEDCVQHMDRLCPCKKHKGKEPTDP